MKTPNTLLASALVSTLSLLAATAAQAQVHPEKPTYAYEKCYGVAKAGTNDCFTATNSCGGTSKTDNAKDAWKYVAKGTCSLMAGGSTSAPK